MGLLNEMQSHLEGAEENYKLLEEQELQLIEKLQVLNEQAKPIVQKLDEIRELKTRFMGETMAFSRAKDLTERARKQTQ